MPLAGLRSKGTSHLALAVALGAALLAGAGAADGQRMEEIALGWVEAHNSGDLEQMAAFRAAHRQGGKEGWEAQFERLVERLGNLEVTDVMIDGEGGLVLGVVSSERGELRLQYEFSSEDPEQIAGIRITAGGERRPNTLPELTLDGATGWEARGEAIDRYLERLAEADLFSGAVLIAEGGEVRFRGAYGLASREFSVPNTLATRFDIGSITKDFTRVAIAQLIAAGKLGLDDPLGLHFPDYPNEGALKAVTVRHLFEHRSGLGDYFTPEWLQTPMGALRDHDDYVAIWGPKPLEFEPGTRSSYSNFGFTVLGMIVEAASGQSYFDYVAEHVFAPAGMTASGFFETDAIVPDVAVGYTYMVRGGERGDVLRKNIYLEPAKGGPWGKTYCTVDDLWRFWTALSRHELTPAAYTPWVLLSGPPPEAGTVVENAEPIPEIGLGGGGPGLSSVIEAWDGRVLIVLANLDPPVATHLRRRLAAALDG